jgi:hypothetical protein
MFLLVMDVEDLLLLRITVLEFSALLQHSIALYCVLPVIKLRY